MGGGGVGRGGFGDHLGSLPVPKPPAQARGTDCLKCIQEAKPTPHYLFGILARDSELSCVARDGAVNL